LCATALTSVPALAQSGATVAVGGASIATPSANTTIVTQTSEKAIINWQSLNVPAGGLLQFLQPNAGAIALNRVLGGTPSSILGSLIANGQVWIINPAGILFGRGASVNVAGLIATTSNISDQNFLNGNYVFDQPTVNANAAVVNNGSITVASGGAAVLAGERVANNGLIEANLGTVTLAAGNEFTVDFNGDSLISFAISAPVSETPQGRGGTAAQALVSNSGTLSAPGGEVLLTAQAARSVLTNAINTTGMISATTAHEENGEIVLDAGPTGAANVSGTLDASGKGAGQTGGTIAMTGGSVTVAGNAVLDASGDQGGGTIALGGDLHGAGSLADAAATTVAPGAVINASAITNGNGGTVSVWSSGSTIFNGTILVEGGSQGGDGGLAETSGANLSVTSGTVDALAASGAAGTWLLDPADIVVATGGTATLANVGSFGSNAGATDTIDPSVIDNASANVALDATQDITFSNAVAISKAGIGLTATAGDSITVNAPIATNDGAITFTANSNANGTASTSGSITLGASLTTTSGVSAGTILLVIAPGVSGAASTGTIGVSAGASIDGGAVTMTANAVVTLPSIEASTLTVVASSISQSGVLTIARTTGLTAAAGDITLANPANNFGGAVYVTAADATIASSGSINFGNVNTTGNFTVQSTGAIGNLPFSIGGTIDLDVAAGGTIDLSKSSNVFSGPIVLGDATLGGLELNSSTAIALPAVSVAGDLIVTAPGITQTGAWSVGGQTELSAGGDDVVLAKAANSFSGEFFTFNARTVTLAAAAPIDFGTVDITQNLTVTAPGIVQDDSEALTVPGTLTLAVGSANSIVLDSTGNSFSGPIVVSGDAANVTLVNTVPLTLSPIDISGDLSVTAPEVALAGAITTTGSQSYTGALVLLGNATLAASGGSSAVSLSGDSTLDTGFALAVLAGGNVTVGGTIENAGTGAITLVAGWDGATATSLAPITAGAFGLGGATLTIGGATASGNAAVGSAGGATTVAAGNLDLDGQNGFAQLGFDGGGATGTILVALTGNLAMTGGAAGDYVQIGHGGLGTSGSEGGAISVAAAGTIDLDGGSGTDAYAQIGHGGALSNEGTTVAFSDTGDISVAGLAITLTAGGGTGAYVQIGHGGLDAGASATLSSGSIVFSGDIAVTSTDPLTMAGDGLSAYAQIGNGGFGADGHATLADGGAITESGDIDVTTGTSASSGAVALVGDAYAQIGNGGYAINQGASASGGIDESGTISLNVLGSDGTGELVGGDTGPWAYAQIGNGDASGTGAGNVSGGISMTLATPIQLVDGTAATAWMWNATGSGTVSGITSVDGAAVFPPGEAPAPPPPVPPPTFDLSDLPGFDSIDATNGTAPPVLTNDNPTPISASGSVAFNGGSTNEPVDTSSLASSLNAIAPTAGGSSSGAGAIEQLADSSQSGGSQGAAPSAGAAQEGDELSSEVALSLTGKAGVTQTTTCIRTGAGETILCQLAPEPGFGKTPVGVQPADQPYSSWGNDSLWQQ
jgi:filamentous hemagglutinin family protein